jgi:hypothetical protein
VDTADRTPGGEGCWGVYLVFRGSGELAANPGSVYPITATCFAAEGVEGGTISYASESFTALAKGGPPPITIVTPPIIAAPTFTA